MIDGEQTMRPHLLISNLMDQSEKVGKFKGSFWLKNLFKHVKLITLLTNSLIHVDFYIN